MSGPEQAGVVQGDLPYSRGSLLASEGVVPGAPEPVCGSSCRPAHVSRFTLPPSAPGPPRAEPSCVEAVQRFARHLGLSRRVASQLSLCRRSSTRRLYQLWCTEQGHSISSPSVAKIADFLVYLHTERHLSVAAIKGYRSTLVSVFKSRMPELLDNVFLRDVIRSFEIEWPHCPVDPPSWDLVKVLSYLCGSSFEPLSNKPLRLIIMKVAFLLALATAKRVGELQALSCRMASHGPDMSLSYLPEFVAKTESEKNPLPRSFLVRSLEEFVGDLSEERVLCPIRAVKIYLHVTDSVTLHPRSLLASPRRPTCSLSKNALFFFLQRVIIDADAVEAGALPPRAHSVRAVATSPAFLKNWSVSKVLEAATWRSNPVFTSYYLRDLSYTLDSCRSLGPFVAGVIVFLS